jgi:hypothetical protein
MLILLLYVVSGAILLAVLNLLGLPFLRALLATLLLLLITAVLTRRTWGARAELLLRRMLAYPLLKIQLLLLVLAAWGVIGSDLGIEGLFWNERPTRQFFVGLSLGWIAGVIFFIHYLLERRLPARDADAARDAGMAPEACPVGAWPTLFPAHVDQLLHTNHFHRWQRNWAVRRLGCYQFWLMLTFFVVVLLGKLIIGLYLVEKPPDVEEYYFESRGWLVPMGVGMGCSMLFAWGMFMVDNYFGRWVPQSLLPGVQVSRDDSLRDVICRQNWFLNQYAMRKGLVVPADYALHASAVYLGIVSVLLFVGFAASTLPMFGGFVTPVALFCLMLILFNAFAGYASFQWEQGRVVIGAFVGLGLLFNSTWLFPWVVYNVKFPGLESVYEDPVKIGVNDVGHDFLEAHLKNHPTDTKRQIGAEEMLKAMCQRWRETGPGKAQLNSKPRIFIVSASGGGIRAAVWTGVVLEGLEKYIPGIADQRVPGFRDHLRVITGASGGMVGATLYSSDFERTPAQRLPMDPETGLGELTGILSQDSLSQTVQTMLLKDFLLNGFLPFRVGTDRGRTLEQAWDASTQSWAGQAITRQDEGGNPYRPFSRPLTDLAKWEREARRPSLIYSPMMVEDSRRLLISNLSLADLTTTTGQSEESTFHSPGVRQLSLSGIEFWRLFPDASQFQVGTAARMNATFPVISPAVSLPTNPPRRIVDAGYYDNYGVDLAAMWLFRNREYIKRYTSGVALVQIRAFRLGYAGDHFRYDDPFKGVPPEKRGPKINDLLDEYESKQAVPISLPAQAPIPSPEGDNAFSAMVGAVSAPLQALLTARGWTAYHRNNELIDLLQREFNSECDPDFFTTVWFELETPAALNWYLSQAEAKRIVLGFFSNTDHSDLRFWIRHRVMSLKKWFGNGGQKVDQAIGLSSGAGGAWAYYQ